MMTVGHLLPSKDKPLKRGAGGKEAPTDEIPHRHDLSLSTSTPRGHELKPGVRAHGKSRGSRSLRNWSALTIAIVCFICIVKFGLLAYVHFLHGFTLDGENRRDGSGLTSFRSARFGFRGGTKLGAKEVEWKRQMRSLVDEGITCDPRFAVLKVFMYDLPSEFHFGLIDDSQPSLDSSNVWPQNLSNLPKYPAALNHQHSTEYWLTADLLTSDQPGRDVECTAVRMKTPTEADLIFVPFFATLGWIKFSKQKHENGEDPYEDLQDRLVKYLHEQKAWRESGGRDHVFVMHHPNGLGKVRDQIKSGIFLVSDFGRFSDDVANLQKDVVAPYKHVVPSFTIDSTTFDSRTTLLFFRGVVVRKQGGIIRQQMYELLREEEGVKFVNACAQNGGIRSATEGMRNSKFCLSLAGDTPSSNRLFDAIASHCVPVIISDEIELPFEDVLDYSEFCVFVRAMDALKKGFVVKLLRDIQKEEWTRMWLRLHTVARHFEYQIPSLPMDAVHMLWGAIAKRVSSVKLAMNKDGRYARSRWIQLPENTQENEE